MKSDDLIINFNHLAIFGKHFFGPVVIPAGQPDARRPALPSRRGVLRIGFATEFVEDIGGVSISAGGKSAELGQVAFFGGGFDELVRRVAASGCGQAAQLVEVPSLGRAFDKFRDGVEVPADGLVTQGGEFRI